MPLSSAQPCAVASSPADYSGSPPLHPPTPASGRLFGSVSDLDEPPSTARSCIADETRKRLAQQFQFLLVLEGLDATGTQLD